MEDLKKLTGKTLVPVSLVVTMLGGSGWLTNQHYMAAANAEQIRELKIDLDAYKKNQDTRWREVQKSLNKIAGALGEISGRLNR